MALAKPTVYPNSQADPLYVEASALLSKRLTGIGRLVARLLAAITQLRPVRLVTTIQAETARNQRLSTSLLCGQEIALTAQDAADADGDIAVWARQILRRPRRRHDVRESSRHAGLYTMLRPAERHFRRIGAHDAAAQDDLAAGRRRSLSSRAQRLCAGSRLRRECAPAR